MTQTLSLTVYGTLLHISFVFVAVLCQGQSVNRNYIEYYDRPQYNCSIPRIVQGEWYSREKNLDTVTIIDATNMQRRGVCLENTTDYAGNYTFLFGENPNVRGSCYHCVRIFARTVNIIEKIESKH